MRFSVIPITVLALSAALYGTARSFPIGLSVRGGIGKGYYSMKDVNDYFHDLSRESGVTIDDLKNGVNLKVEGRVWFMDRIAGALGYQRYWASTSLETSERQLSLKAPADIYTVGGVINVLPVPMVLDVNVGINWCWARPILSTNALSTSFTKEFKGTDDGVEIFGEVVTNFIKPIEVGLQLGYRNLKISNLEDKFGDPPSEYIDLHNSKISVEYSGVFFYLTAGIRI